MGGVKVKALATKIDVGHQRRSGVSECSPSTLCILGPPPRLLPCGFSGWRAAAITSSEVYLCAGGEWAILSPGVREKTELIAKSGDGGELHFLSCSSCQTSIGQVVFTLSPPLLTPRPMGGLRKRK